MKMKIRVGNDETKAELTRALEAVNGKAVSFTVTSEMVIAELVLRAEKYPDKHEIPSRDRPGAKLIFRPAGPAVNAYRFKAISTEIELTRGGSGWYLTGARRAPVYPRAGERFRISITDRALYNAIRRILVAFGTYTLSPATLAEAAKQRTLKNDV
ncbi:hypothetical protein [Bradyrhizobium liaoningense]|uniref:hypothetical protein n=1 Tax=Bradyrhizobium liaoningense TaxID=43992 RepID=UPI001BA5C4AD|nr:hypothetical protein [Bradyrhizobium liaoningense]MBR0822400.1 hypothetical protein [Bradyrhizobium liaoningense]